MISKDLVGMVLGMEVTQVAINNNQLKYNGHHVKNIHEFAHDCKAWAFNQGYELTTRPDNIDCLEDDVSPKGKILYWSAYLNSLHVSRKGTEPQVVFEACEWILKESK